MSLEDAGYQHVLAGKLLDHGLDPAALKAAVGKHLFAVVLEADLAKCCDTLKALLMESNARFVRKGGSADGNVYAPCSQEGSAAQSRGAFRCRVLRDPVPGRL